MAQTMNHRVAIRLASLMPLLALPALAALAALLLGSFPALSASAAAPSPSGQAGITASTVAFDSADGRTRLTGYLFRPAGEGPFPAIVLMHGRAGLYSTLPGSTVSLDSLSARHRYWARFWASQGYVALLVDGFAPRGYPTGFGRGSYGARPPEVSEQTVRPLDADGAATFLQGHADVITGRIGLFGWSNGAMAILARVTRPLADRLPGTGTAAGPGGARSPDAGPFRAAIALYPGCVIPERAGARPQVPLLLLIAGDDDEVSPKPCARWATTAAAASPGFAWRLHEGAAHNFDGLALGSRATDADRTAASDAEALALDFFAQHLAERAR